ncbi:rod shape-determining protein MreC [Sphingomonas xinjiangensis]|uniref:Cell shape-determining protein MreC n=1 Tax=Sphingomonas xinjiangensis TaxID=643568 RepID=A0A840YFX9_9SPHN|nr:rod shape-determining protein MreC [Sphingomonas xinjiangensis]MBB5710879.1 rod shape-determining protein MreC [Sphingomonas xinjiangensis]
MAPPGNRRPGFSRRAQYGLFFTYVGAISGALAGAVLLLVSAFNPPAFAALRRAVAEVITPVSSGLAWASDGVAGVPSVVGSYFAVHSENARLKKQLTDERALVTRAQTLVRENAKLRALLKLRDVGNEIVVTARLVNSSATSTRRYATLNAGLWQGVRQGQPVREAGGLVGQVIESGPNTARVLLIVDAESIVPVRRTRDGLPAIAAGRGDGLIEIRSAGAAAMIFRPGDAFVTSGTGGIFPPDVPVAHVVKPGRDVAVAEPAANPSVLDFAIVQPSFLPPPPPPPTPSPTPAATPAAQ